MAMYSNKLELYGSIFGAISVPLQLHKGMWWNVAR